VGKQLCWGQGENSLFRDGKRRWTKSCGCIYEDFILVDTFTWQIIYELDTLL
jgi:hypothetical protein